ncbi:MAG: serine/threonine protein kinase [Pyrinomonadaceae bacterium]
MKPLAQNTLIQNRYLIVHLIGKGGMGEVYLAVDQRLGSAVALKRTFFAGDEMLSNAFEREARILARMRHPVLPKVSDHFSEGEEQYLVMEHISGDDLAKRLEGAQKPFPLSWVMFWADQLLDALSYLHSHEPPIIHRDIKPQNLKLTDENHVILLDFGLSKNSAAQTKTNDSGSTGSTGSVVGYTPHYAPMEQIRGIGTSPKSDIYSLSATLYQLLTNSVPPDALSRADTMLNGSPDPIKSPTMLNPEIPPAVSEVLLKGMEVSQDKRYSNAKEMQKAMRKAYAQMQDQMGAATMVMSSEGTSQSDSVPVLAPSMDKTEVMDFAANPAMSVPTAIAGASNASEAPTNLVSQPTPRSTPAFDPNATVAFDSEPHLPESRQADVKTEVFLAGSNSLPTPGIQSEPLLEEIPAYNDFSTPGQTDDFSAAEIPFDPNATVPISAFAGSSDVVELPNQETNYYSSAEAEESAPSGFESAASFSSNGQAAASQSAPAVVTAQPVKKSSGGKVFAIVGGLLVLLVLGAGALGGGLYYYANYYAVEPEASPSPLPSVEPSAEPSVDFASQTNSSDVNTNSDIAGVSNSNTTTSNSNETLTVAPTPEPRVENDSTPQQTGSTTRPTQTRNTPTTRPATTPPPIAKATPKAASTPDRKKIVQ